MTRGWLRVPSLQAALPCQLQQQPPGTEAALAG